MAINTEARTPTYDGVSESEWSAPDFNECVEGYYNNHPDTARPDDPINDVTDAPQSVRNWIASLSLLGNADAETFADLLFFPCVEPSSMNLNRNALEAVNSGRGASADIPEEALTSARKKAYQLLVSEFDYDQDSVPDEYKSQSLDEKMAGIIREKAEEFKES